MQLATCNAACNTQCSMQHAPCHRRRVVRARTSAAAQTSAAALACEPPPAGECARHCMVRAGREYIRAHELRELRSDAYQQRRRRLGPPQQRQKKLRIPETERTRGQRPCARARECVCVSVCVWVCAREFTRENVCISVRAGVCVCVCARVRERMRQRASRDARLRVRVHACRFVGARGRVCAHARACPTRRRWASEWAAAQRGARLGVENGQVR